MNKDNSSLAVSILEDQKQQLAECENSLATATDDTRNYYVSYSYN
jgi:hypothetical protein